jgi:PAS domain S-box-containing protein
VSAAQQLLIGRDGRDGIDQADAPALLEFLATLTEAPDCPTASAYLLARLTVRRAVLMLVDPVRDILSVYSSIGVPVDELGDEGLSLGDERHPLVVSAMTMTTVSGSSLHFGLPFAEWVAFPMPQPTFRGAPVPIAGHHASQLVAGVGGQVTPASLRPGQAPLGVVVIEGVPAPQRLAFLSRLVALAGPVIARFEALGVSDEQAERLRQQRDRLRMMIDALPDPIVITDSANDIVVQNARAEQLLSSREGDSQGRRRAVEINNLLFTSYLSKAMMTGAIDKQSGPRELNLVDPTEGADILFEVLAHPLRDDVDRKGAFLSVLRDVTDLRRAVNELERHMQRVRLAEIDATRERDRLNLILENVADPILVTDDRSNIILMNEQAERLFEAPPPTAVTTVRGRRVQAQAVRGNDMKFTSFISDFAMATATARRAEMTLTRPDTGDALPMEVVSGKIRNERDEAIAIVSVLHDLTKQYENTRLYEELKRSSEGLEARIRAATADLAEQNAKLQWQTQEVERANTLKSEFLASMSHELRTPINAVLGHTANMIEGIYGGVSDDQLEMLKRIRSAANHLLALINDILDLARIEAGKMPLRIEYVHVKSIVTEISQQIEPLVRRKGLDYVIEVPPDCPPLRTDRTKVKQVLLNLLSNAIKFTPRGKITLRAECDADSVKLRVTDTGIGIKTKDLSVIWEDFRQVDQTLIREYGGTGLGLSITRKLLERLGGRAEVASEYGKGTTFTVTLPWRVEEEAHAITPADQAALP